MDITKPFNIANLDHLDLFDWDSALREDVFPLAIKYDSFASFDKENVLEEIAGRGAAAFLSLAENAGWEMSEKCVERLIDISFKNGFAETTA